MRGPLALPGPLTPDGIPGVPSVAQDFDTLVLSVLDQVRAQHPESIDGIELAVEDHPLLPDDWQRRVPYASSVPADTDDRARVVLFRRPILTHAEGDAEIASIVLDTIVTEVAELSGIDPDDLDPRGP